MKRGEGRGTSADCSAAMVGNRSQKRQTKSRMGMATRLKVYRRARLCQGMIKRCIIANSNHVNGSILKYEGEKNTAGVHDYIILHDELYASLSRPIK